MIKRQVVSCLGWLIAAVFFGLYRENTSFIRNLRTSESIPQSQCTKGKIQVLGVYFMLINVAFVLRLDITQE